MKKKIAALFLSLIAAIAFSQPQTGGFGTGGNTGRLGPSFNSLAFFEFAPTSGAGMGSACACANITGAKGETLTFTRTGSATCSRQGLAATGIANGDLVTCSASLPRVESSGGVLGLRVESSRTNDALRSQEFTNAYWQLASGGAPNPGNPVVTADQAAAPDGTISADRIDFASTTGTGFGVVFAGPFLSTATSWTHSVYVRGASGAGTVYVMATPGGSYNTAACAFVSTSWTRCTVTGTETAANWFLQIGYDLRDGAQTGQGAQSVFVWGAQRENGAYATSYIPTVATAVTRNADAASFAVSVPTSSGVCTSATTQVPSLLAYASGAGLYAPMLSQLAGSPSSPYLWPFTAGAGTSLAIDAAGSSGVPTTYSPALDNATLTGRYVAGHNGTSYSYCVNSTCRVNGSSSAWSSPTYQFIRLTGAGDHSQIWTNVQVDPAFSRCAR